jgi:hypothetical protein
MSNKFARAAPVHKSWAIKKLSQGVRCESPRRGRTLITKVRRGGREAIKGNHWALLCVRAYFARSPGSRRQERCYVISKRRRAADFIQVKQIMCRADDKFETKTCLISLVRGLLSVVKSFTACQVM